MNVRCHQADVNPYLQKACMTEVAMFVRHRRRRRRRQHASHVDHEKRNA